MKYYLVAGEASGDLHASNLMKSIKKLDDTAKFRFFGGDLMQAVGGELVKHYRELAFMGIINVVMNSRTILRNLAICKKDIESFSPDVVILIDYPGFNLKIAKHVKKKLGIPVHYYISPKVWAWKEYRVKSFKKYVDEMLCILPFEVDFFKKHNYNVHYVGNPTVDAISSRSNQDETFDEFIATNNLENKPILALLAGSRTHEIKDNLPIMLEAVKGHRANYQLVVAGAPGIDEGFYNEVLGTESDVRVIFGETYRILAQSEAALVTSGTATLETALLDVPQVVCFSMTMPKLSSWAFNNLLHTKYISLVNLICGYEVVKEYFAASLTIENVQSELERLLHDKDYRKKMLDSYREMKDILGAPGASDRAANIIYEKING